MRSEKNKIRKNKLKQQQFNSLQKITNLVESLFLDLFDIIGLYKFVDWYIEHQEGMRYLVFGGISTIINIIVFALLEKIGFKNIKLYSDFSKYDTECERVIFVCQKG